MKTIAAHLALPTPMYAPILLAAAMATRDLHPWRNAEFTIAPPPTPTSDPLFKAVEDQPNSGDTLVLAVGDPMRLSLRASRSPAYEFCEAFCVLVDKMAFWLLDGDAPPIENHGFDWKQLPKILAHPRRMTGYTVAVLDHAFDGTAFNDLTSSASAVDNMQNVENEEKEYDNWLRSFHTQRPFEHAFVTMNPLLALFGTTTAVGAKSTRRTLVDSFFGNSTLKERHLQPELARRNSVRPHPPQFDAIITTAVMSKCPRCLSLDNIKFRNDAMEHLIKAMDAMHNDPHASASLLFHSLALGRVVVRSDNGATVPPEILVGENPSKLGTLFENLATADVYAKNGLKVSRKHLDNTIQVRQLIEPVLESDEEDKNDLARRLERIKTVLLPVIDDKM